MVLLDMTNDNFTFEVHSMMFMITLFMMEFLILVYVCFSEWNHMYSPVLMKQLGVYVMCVCPMKQISVYSPWGTMCMCVCLIIGVCLADCLIALPCCMPNCSDSTRVLWLLGK